MWWGILTSRQSVNSWTESKYRFWSVEFLPLPWNKYFLPHHCLFLWLTYILQTVSRIPPAKYQWEPWLPTLRRTPPSHWRTCSCILQQSKSSPRVRPDISKQLSTQGRIHLIRLDSPPPSKLKWVFRVVKSPRKRPKKGQTWGLISSQSGL